ncbi:MAG TPA: alpha/beta hydrolase, partial [Ktedonobacteraceae bacterium]|nr:alpha/beta hydrolase [Ktedonobacteraceae bacterium]
NSTPFVWGQDMQRRITNSHLLVNQIDGHTAFNRSACATQVIVTYLVQGTLPSQGVTCSN